MSVHARSADNQVWWCLRLSRCQKSCLFSSPHPWSSLQESRRCFPSWPYCEILKSFQKLVSIEIGKKTELPGRKSFSRGKSIRQKTKGFGLSCHFRHKKHVHKEPKKNLIDSQDFQEKWLDRIYLVLDLTACSPSPRTFKKTEPWLPLKLTLSLRHA